MDATKRPLSRKRSERREELRRLILDSSVELFMENGYEKTTTRQIIQKAGILNGSLYNIFGSKDDIFSEILMEAIEDAMRRSEDVLWEDATFIDRLGFVICLQIFAANRSARIAELLSAAYLRRSVSERVSVAMIEWLRENSTNHSVPVDDPDFEIKMYSCLGALGAVISRCDADPGAVDAVSAMRVVSGIFADTFGVSTPMRKRRSS